MFLASAVDASSYNVAMIVDVVEETPNGICEADQPLDVRPLAEDLTLNLRWQKLPEAPRIPTE